jgi:hypothetical protein
MAAVLAAGALSRGRDSFYSAAAAGCSVALLVEAFFDASLLGTAVAVPAAITLGLGLGQRASRTLG